MPIPPPSPLSFGTLGRRSRRFAVVCMLVAFAAVCAASVVHEPTTVTLTLSVVDVRRAALPGAQVRLWAVAQADRKVVKTESSDSKGEVSFNLYATEWYELEVALQPFFIVTRVGPFEARRDLQFTVTLNSSADTVVVE